ncbi:MAG: M23 family metallopeptidase [Bacteroidota bacterium]|nr:M23 family metallopeptidase [Bacteroidota bacterium]
MKFRFLTTLILLLNTLTIFAQDRYAANILYGRRHALLDSVIMQELKDEESEQGDLYEGLYENWSSTKVDPYSVNFGKLKDSLVIDCRGYYPPCLGCVTSPFGPRGRRFHNGIDLRLGIGDTVHAAFSGRIRVRRYNSGGYGYFLVLRHKDGVETLYAHLSKFLVAPNQEVRAGQAIALGGSTGHSTGPHLHFEVRLMGNPINPAKLFSFTDYMPLRNKYYVVKDRTFEERMSYAGNHSGYTGAANRFSNLAFYTVQKGDNLGGIASRNHISLAALCRLNNIRSTAKLMPGQRLRLS